MTTVKTVFETLNQWAPFDTQMGFDNAGILIGSGHKEVTKIGVVLDVTSQAVDYAIAHHIDLIISHHPVIFSGFTQLDYNDVVYKLVKNDISVISAHTNFDKYRYGTCYAMAEKLCLTPEYDENIEIGLKAVTDSITVRQLAERCKAVFKISK